uniref:NADH dehydrogenase subunit 2 n=1 Tax=Schistosoma haematobium TaxID=6185 RepID=A0A516EZX8_SCHHA|nr:NADH dehydrogenase subunit 2 [Schistosoma haematobium]QDO72099.1 NADH dehydrogenase subunit 2 [Schistosoma haematobium]
MVKVYVSILLIVLLSLLTLVSGDILMFWLFLELCSLSMVPCLLQCSKVNVGDSLLSYIFAISISSSLMLVGLLYCDFFFFFLVGFMVKFGVFPFIIWVYGVFNNSCSWVVCWCISILMKISLLSVSYFVYGWDSFIFSLCVILGLFFSGLMFWLYTINWFNVWTHMVVSSSGVMIYMLSSLGVDEFIFMFVLYMVWGSGVILYFGVFNGFIGYLIWLISVPFSFSFIYKIVCTYYLVGLGFYVLLFWFVYCFLEQLYLFKWLASGRVVKSVWFGGLLSW